MGAFRDSPHGDGALCGKLNGMRRRCQAWECLERVSQAPSLAASMMCVAVDWLAKEERAAATIGILLAHSGALHIRVLSDLRPGGVAVTRNVAVTVLRDRSPPRSAMQKPMATGTPAPSLPGRQTWRAPLMGIAAYKFRKLWRWPVDSQAMRQGRRGGPLA